MKPSQLLAVLPYLSWATVGSPIEHYQRSPQSSTTGNPTSLATISKYPTLASISYDCAPASDGSTNASEERRRLWDELDVQAYLIDWFENHKPSTKNSAGAESSLFGVSQESESGPFFPEVFSASVLKGGKTGNSKVDQVECHWGSCKAPSCSDAKQLKLDARAWLVMKALENAQLQLHTMQEAFLWKTVQANLKTDEIVKSVAYNIYDPPLPPAKKVNPLDVIGVLGMVLGAAIPFMGPAAASRMLPTIVKGASIAGKGSKFLPKNKLAQEKPSIKKEEIVANINARLENGMMVWEAMTSGAFEEILQKGRHPGHDWDAGVENAKAGEMMAEFLLDELFWKGGFRKDAIESTVNRMSLNGALEGSRHFVVKSNMPRDMNLSKDQWVYNCNSLAGGVADEDNGICWSLQAMRSDSNWPWADQSDIGTELKNKDNIYKITDMLDFYHQIDTCSKANNGTPFQSMPADDNWSTSVLTAAIGSPNQLAPCIFNIPVVERYSICHGDLDEHFPWDKPACVRSPRGHSELKFYQEKLFNEVAAGVKTCNIRESRQDFHRKSPYDYTETASIACSNKIPEPDCYRNGAWMSLAIVPAEIDELCSLFDGVTVDPGTTYHRQRDALRSSQGAPRILEIRYQNDQSSNSPWKITRASCIRDARDLAAGQCFGDNFDTAGGSWKRKVGTLVVDINNPNIDSCFKNDWLPVDSFIEGINRACDEIGERVVAKGKTESREITGLKNNQGKETRKVTVKYSAEKDWFVRPEDCKRAGIALVSGAGYCRGKNNDSGGGRWKGYSGAFTVDAN